MTSFQAGSIHGDIFLNHAPAAKATKEVAQDVRNMKQEVDGAMKGWGEWVA